MQTNQKVGEISVLTKEGDTKHFWDPQNKDEVKAAAAIFKSYKDQGFIAAKMNRKGEKGEVIKEFDPSASSILFIPQMTGGL